MSCEHEVPRNANGWPTVEPKFFTETQLRMELKRWAGCKDDLAGDGSRTVGHAEYDMYAAELLRRGFKL